MDTEEVSMKLGKWELTVLLTEAEENDNILLGQECAKRCAAAPSLSSCPVQESCTKSDSPEESVRGGDTISSPVQDNLQATRKSGFAQAGDSIIPAPMIPL